MASSCIPTGGGLRLPDLDMVKAAAAGGAAPPGAHHSAPLRPASHHSSASSTLSEASNSSSTSSLSLKRARTPRKRPNQTYNEAAALLASMYPSVFPAAAFASGGGHTPRLLGLASSLADDPSCADLLPPFPVLGNAACLLRDAPPPSSPAPRSPVVARTCLSPAAVSSAFFTEFRDSAPSPGTPDGAAADEPGELDFDDDDGFDADSFLLGPVEGAAAEGIDGIMGKLSMEGSAAAGINRVLSSSGIDPYIRSLMVLGLGFQRSRPNIKQALKRHDDDSEWWMCPAIPLKDITPTPPPAMALPPPVEKKKKKTKKKALKDIVVGQCKKHEEEFPDSVYGDDGILALKAPKTGLGLSLNTEEVLKAWYDRGSVFADGNVPESSSTDGLAKLSDIELFLENGAAGVIKEGGIQKTKHKQKQCTPLLSNKTQTRYQARKVNAECHPRVKGRFVSHASLLQNTVKKES